MKLPFKGTEIEFPEELNEVGAKVAQLMTQGNVEAAKALWSAEAGKALTPDVLAQMQAAVKAEEERLRLG